MTRLLRTVGSVVIASGIAVGFEGCPGDGWQLDPPNRVAYEGPHTAQAVACAEATWTHGIYEGDVMVRAISDQIEIRSIEPSLLHITGRTTHEFASRPDVVSEWECSIEDSGDRRTPELISDEIVSD
jgi:hypothetical protein